MDNFFTSTTSAEQQTPQRSTACGTTGCVNVGDVERFASIVAGGGLALAGLRNLSSLSGLAMTLVGGSLVFRGVTGHCQMYEQLGMDTTTGHGSATAVPAHHGVKIEKSVTINRSPDEIYRFWRTLSNLPKFMEHLVSVEESGANRSHWVAKGPLGTTVEWDAEIINERPGEMIAWRSVEGSQVDTAGSVHFVPAPGGRGTEVRVSLKYNPPGGKLGIGIAKLLAEDPEKQIQQDLNRLKQVLETGELATGAAHCATGTPGYGATGAPGASAGTGTHPRVDEASDESFPASDPPAWTATSATDTGGVDRYK